MNGETNWVPGLVALGAGLFVAILFALSKRTSVAPMAGAGDAEVLDARYQELLRQLKQHAANKHLLPADAWAAEQARLEQTAAQVLREKAGVKHEAVKAEARAAKRAEAATGFFAKNPALAGAIWGGAGVAFFVFLGFALTQETTARKEGGGPMMGPGQTVAPSPGAASEPPDPKLAGLLQRAKREPDDVEVLSAAAQELIRRQMFDEAEPLVTRATMLDPYHVKTRIWRGVLSALSGPPEPALAELEHLADTYEEAWDARLYAGALAAQTDQPARALKHFERYVAEAPDSEQPPMLRKGIEELRAQVQAGPQPQGTQGKP